MYARLDPRRRALSGAGALTGLAAMLSLLIQGLDGRRPAEAPVAIRLIGFPIDAPPPPDILPQPRPEQARRERGEAAPPNVVSRATEVATPPAVLPLQPMIVVTPMSAQGADATSGAAPVAGPGSGAGGAGDGSGSGAAGNGSGGGGGTVLRLLRGHIDNRDYPRAALMAGESGTVGLRFTVGTDGRVSDCIVTRSSGSAALDQTTCSLIRKRFRYAPSRDARGRPYADVVTGEQIWELYDDPAKERRARDD